VRDFEPDSGWADVLGLEELHNAAGDKVKAIVAPELFAFGQKDLHTEADSKERLSGTRELADRLDQPEFLEVGHSRAKRADAREDQFVCFEDLAGVLRQGGILPHAFKRFLHAPQVAHSVVDDPYQAVNSFAKGVFAICDPTRV
jgi:hypothetical protein